MLRLNQLLTLSMDFQFTASIEKLWSALTDSSKLAKWVANIQTGEGMENNFISNKRESQTLKHSMELSMDGGNGTASFEKVLEQ